MFARLRDVFRRAILPVSQVKAEEDDVDPEELPSVFRCPITQELFVQPVCASDGHTYEKSALLDWFKTGNHTSPLTRRPIKPGSIHPNRALHAALLEHKKMIRKNRRLEAALSELDSDGSTQSSASSTWKFAPLAIS